MQMANFAFASTQKWVHTRYLTGQEYNVLQTELKVSIVPMDSSSSWCIGRGVPEFGARVDIAGRGLFTMFGTPQGLNMWLTNECS